MDDTVQNTEEFHEDPKVKYAIVRFLGENNSEGKPLVDISARPWMKKSHDGHYTTKYFPDDCFNKRRKYLKQLVEPKENWKEYPVELISIAYDLKQAERRLEKSLRTRNIETTDSEIQNLPKSTTHKDYERQQVLSLNQYSATSSSQSIKVSDKSSVTAHCDDSSGSSETDRAVHPVKKKDLKRRKKTLTPIIESSSSADSESSPARSISPPNRRATNTLMSHRTQDKENTSKRKDDPPSLGKTLHTVSEGRALTQVVNNTTGSYETLLRDIQKIVSDQVNTAKVSILHDISHKMEELKITMLQNNIRNIPKATNTELAKKFNVKLPVTSLESFLAMEETLNAQDTQNTLVTLYSNIIFSISEPKSCVIKLMETTVGKAVALEYSGSGREINGQAKRSFKDTKTCEAVKAAVISKFQGTVEEKFIQSKISIWLSGAADRDGGRKEREEKKKKSLLERPNPVLFPGGLDATATQ